MTDTAPDYRRLNWAYLSRVAEPPAPAVVAFIREYGVDIAAKRIRNGQVPTAVKKETEARRQIDQSAQDLAYAAQRGMRLVTPEDDEWPAWTLTPLQLAEACGDAAAAAPIALWVYGSGDLAELTTNAVAVVGARAATKYGENTAAELGFDLANQYITVISGAALGIDGAAHRGVLQANGRTIAVLACGLDIQYPVQHSGLLTRIAKNGLVVSEYPPNVRPAKYRFLVRNRLIAALAKGTVVVEAGIRSGAANTAAWARNLGRPVMVVPGPVDSLMSVGCLAMLRAGYAIPVANAAQVLEDIGPVGMQIDVQQTEPPRDTDALSADELRVYEALNSRIDREVAAIVIESGLSLTRVRGLLPVLELAGLAQRGETGWRRCPAKRS